MRKVFVTGANGFIGKNLVKRLVKEKYQVTVLLRNKKDAEFFDKLNVKTVLGDITKRGKFIEEINKNDILIHLAAIRANWGDKETFLRTNSYALSDILQPKSKLKHIILTSSVYAMGTLRTTPANETHPLLAKDNYGISKIYGEKVLHDITQKSKIPYTIVRPAIVYGPGDNELGMMVKMVNLIKKNKLPIIGDGKNLIHLVYLDDLIEAYINILKKGGENQTYIIASEKPIRLIDLISLIKKELKISSKNKFYPKKPIMIAAHLIEKIYINGYKISPFVFRKEPFLSPKKVETLANNWHYDISKAKKELKYKPKVDYKQGIKKILY